MSDSAGLEVMSPMLKTVSFKGERLRGSSNYTTWEFCFRVHLQGRGADELIKETHVITTKEEKLAKQVFAELVAAVEPNVVIEVMGTSTPAQAWKALKERFASQSTAHVIAMGQRLRDKEFTGGNLSLFLDRRGHNDGW